MLTLHMSRLHVVVIFDFAESVTVNPGEERFLKAEIGGGHPTDWPGIVEATESFWNRQV